MSEVNQTIDLIKEVTSNPYTLLFFVVFGVGWFFKEKTQVKNVWIPYILTGLGILLGLTTIQISIKGAAVGFLLSLVIIGAYDHIKPLIKLFKN
jgi:hypothetical protein